MRKIEAEERVEHLKKLVNHERYLYHVLNKQNLSDEALDSLKKELFDLEHEFPDLVTPDSPTQRVGGKPLAEFKKVAREGRRRMNSLEDAFSEDDMRAWLERLENYLGRKVAAPFYCDLKMDGLAVELIYRDGALAQGSTRGDGFTGEDVTQNLRTIDAIPLRLEARLPLRGTSGQGARLPQELIARGEVFMNKKEFARANREQEQRGEKAYANPRNVAAGSIRQLDPKITASRKLDFFAYSIVGREGADREYLKQYPSHSAEYKALNIFGIKTNPHGVVAKTLLEVFAFHEKVKKMREKLPYEIDGIVVTVDDNRPYEEAGIIGKAPRAAVAYKFSPREATTVVESIKVQVGRTGVLTPVAVMRPVRVGGVTITHATLHNADEIERLGLKIGDTVVVSRAGDVIPQITKVLKDLRTGKEKKFTMPTHCPVDGAKAVRDGVAWRCSNPECGARHKESIYHFVSRGGFNLEGMGPKIVDKFLDEGLIADAADIFSLKPGDIAALERFGKKSAENIVREAEERKTITLPKFIYSLGILHVGEETSQLLAKQIIAKIKDEKLKIKNAMRVIQEMSLEELQEIQDIGPKVAESIHGWFHNERNTRFMEKLERAGVRIKRSQESGVRRQALAGKTFVLTGTLESMSREAAKERIRALGGETSESVSAKTSYVVAGAEPGSKLRKAEKLGVRVLDEKEFSKLLGK